MSSAQRIRGVLFYLGLLIFCAGLPFILSFALSYKFNPRTWKFAKAGLISLKTQPDGARIYLDGRLLDKETPLSINELLPGTYTIRVELKDYYPWLGQANVEAGKVTRVEKIILFPLRPDIKQLGTYPFSSFWLDKEAGALYYLSAEAMAVYKSDLDGERFTPIADLLEIRPPPKKWLVSEDRRRLLYYNPHQLAVIWLRQETDAHPDDTSFVINFPDRSLIDVFWHSDNYHLVAVTNRDIEVLEAEPKSAPVILAALNKRNTSATYEVKTDTLYFIDSQKAADGNIYDNLYKIQLHNRLYHFREFMKLTPSPQEARTKSNEKESADK